MCSAYYADPQGQRISIVQVNKYPHTVSPHLSTNLTNQRPFRSISQPRAQIPLTIDAGNRFLVVVIRFLTSLSTRSVRMCNAISFVPTRRMTFLGVTESWQCLISHATWLKVPPGVQLTYHASGQSTCSCTKGRNWESENIATYKKTLTFMCCQVV